MRFKLMKLVVVVLVQVSSVWTWQIETRIGLSRVSRRRKGWYGLDTVCLNAAPPLDESRTAVLLSLNARGVSKKIVQAAKERVAAEDLYVTASLEEARVAANDIVQKGYGTVISGGGDGTLSLAVSQISSARAAAGESQPLKDMPRFVALPLGTGNAVARYIFGPRYRSWRGTKGLKKALAMLRENSEKQRDLRVPVLRVDDSNDLCFIAGCGFDSFILDDYQKLRRAVSGFPGLRSVLSSVFGYFVATATSTLPQYALGNRQMHVRVFSRSAVSYVDPRRGDAALPLAMPQNDSVLLYVLSPIHTLLHRVFRYEGKATIVAVGATPFYGGGMRLFPFARAAASVDSVNLRIALMSPLIFVPNALSIFAGSYRSAEAALDFIGDDFFIEFTEAEQPVQHSGDALGDRHAFRLSVAGHVRFADFLGLPSSLSSELSTST